MRYGSVCSGVEAATLAWRPLGWEAAFFSEIEPFPCAVLKGRFPEVPNLGDMTQITIDSEGRIHGNGLVVEGGIDLLVGGTPCQSFSLAGKREGLDGASGLAFHFIRLLREIHPRWFIWENVPGALSSRTNGQFDFNFLIREYAECGYSLAWRVLDAEYVRTQRFPRAIPQRRRRVFVIGSLGGRRNPAEVLFDGESMFGDPPPRECPREDSPGGTGGGPEGSCEKCVFDMTFPEARNGNVIATLTATDYKGGKAIVDDAGMKVSPTLEANLFNKNTFQDCGKFVVENGVKKPSCFHLNVRDEAILTDVPGSLMTIQGDRMQSYVVEDNGGKDSAKSSGRETSKCYSLDSDGSNSMKSANPHSGIRGADVAKTLDTFVPDPQKNQGGQMILTKKSLAVQTTVYENHTMDARLKEMPDVSPSLTSSMERNEDFNHPLDQTKAIAIAENIIGRKPQNGGNGIGAQVEVAYTQTAFSPQGVATGSAIRRFMPVECERLMGFPDGYTVPEFSEITDEIVNEFVEIFYKWDCINSKNSEKIKWKSKSQVRKWLEKISASATCPDAFRYKVCGNSMCVNCMEWLGFRVAEVEAHE